MVLWVGELSNALGVDPETHYDAATASFTNAAGAEIRHSTGLFLSAYEASVTNNGIMSGASFSPGALLVEQYLDADLDNTSFEFENAGTIDGTVELDLGTTTVTVVNSGQITGRDFAISPATFPDVMFDSSVALAVGNETLGNQTVSFTNSGTISTTVAGGVGAVIELDTENESVPVDAMVTVVNSGTISAMGGASFTNQQYATFLEQGQVLVNFIAGLAVDASDISGESVVTIDNQAGGLIEAGGPFTFVSPNALTPVTATNPGAFTVALYASGKQIDITNSGTISGYAGTPIGAPVISNSIELRDAYLAGAIHTDGDEYGPDEASLVYIASIDTVTNTATGVIIGSIDLGGNNDTLTNRGAITGDVYLRDGDDTVSNYGSLVGNLYLGAGNDSFTQAVSAVFNGTADGDVGTDTFFLDLTGGGTIDQSIYTRLLNFEVFNLIGQGQVDVVLGGDDDDFANGGDLEGDVSLGGGDNSFANTGTVTGNVSGGESADEVANEGTIDGSVDLGAGDNTFTNEGTVTGDVVAGDNGDAVENDGEVEGSVDLGGGDNSLANDGTVQGVLETQGDVPDPDLDITDWTIQVTRP